VDVASVYFASRRSLAMESYAYFKGGFVPLADAKVGVMTHAFN
jgi:hypothetical protein